MMRKQIKHLASIVLIPLTRWYLRKDRSFTYRGITVIVKPGVFHPGFFSSTKFLLDYLRKQNVKGSTLLELGCGTGLISIWASAKQEAIVTASDISAPAIQNTRLNAVRNSIQIEIIQSDLFENIPYRLFGWIIINPPYYAKNPTTEAEMAWYCGEGFEYFIKLFRQIVSYFDEHSKVLMVLTKGCDLKTIRQIANDADLELLFLDEKKVLFDDKDYLYRIVKKH